jgi:hypothetical protein
MLFTTTTTTPPPLPQGPDNIWTYHTTMSKFSDMYGIKVTFFDGETTQTRTTEMER